VTRASVANGIGTRSAKGRSSGEEVLGVALLTGAVYAAEHPSDVRVEKPARPLYTAWTLTAFGPLSPASESYVTFAPSASER
jgi:hypothetical protein